MMVKVVLLLQKCALLYIQSARKSAPMTVRGLDEAHLTTRPGSKVG